MKPNKLYWTKKDRELWIKVSKMTTKQIFNEIENVIKQQFGDQEIYTLIDIFRKRMNWNYKISSAYTIEFHNECGTPKSELMVCNVK